MQKKNREKQIVQASWIAIVGNAFLSIIKIVAGFISGSMALIADGVDSASDILTSLITLVTARIISKPPTEKHPYGYDKADTIASNIVAFVVLFAGLQLAISTVGNLIEGKISEMPSMFAIIVVVVSIIGKLFLALFLSKTGKRIDSPMLRANGKNMASDVIISSSVLVGLVFTHVFKIPILDSITALCVSIWIMIVALRIIIQSSKELLDGVDDASIYEKIDQAVKIVPEAYNPHRIRARKMVQYYMIVLDIEVDGNKTMNEAHEIAHHVEDEIRKRIDNVYDVLVHVEPINSDRTKEVFGVSREDIAE